MAYFASHAVFVLSYLYIMVFDIALYTSVYSKYSADFTR